MIRLRRVSEDTLVAPRRGEPPVAPDGYEKTADPFVFKITMPKCQYREERLQHRPCCPVIIIWCTKHNVPIKRLSCVERTCDRVPEKVS